MHFNRLGRRELMTLLVGVVVARQPAGRAQQAGRTYRLGMLWPFPRKAGGAADDVVIAALVDELQRRGFIEGQDLAIDYREWAALVDLISDYAAELAKVRV